MQTTQSSLESAGWGILRAMALEVLFQPIRTVKVVQQLSQESETSMQIVRRLFKEGGIPRFYRGMMPSFIEVSLKQGVIWSLTLTLPQSLEQRQMKSVYVQAITGVTVSLAVAMITAPFNKTAIQKALEGRGQFVWSWKGAPAIMSKFGIPWCIYLEANKKLSDEIKVRREHQKLTWEEIILVGIGSAVIVNSVSPILDRVVTLIQSERASYRNILSRECLRNMYKGVGPHSLVLYLQAIISSVMIDRLSVPMQSQTA